MRLPNGTYRTAGGSRLEVSGKHSGIFRLAFDWLGEPGACIECKPRPDPEEFGPEDMRIVWSCKHHTSGSARLFAVEE